MPLSSPPRPHAARPAITSVATAALVLASAACDSEIESDPADDGSGGSTSSATASATTDAAAGTSSSGTTSTGAGPAVTCVPGEPAVLIAEIPEPRGLVHDADSIYVSNRSEDGALYRVAKDGSAVETIMPGVAGGDGLAFAAGAVYFGAGLDGIFRLPASGGEPTRIATTAFTEFAALGDYLYVASHIRADLVRVPLEGGEQESIPVGTTGILRIHSVAGVIAWSTPELGIAVLDGAEARTISDREALSVAGLGDELYAISSDAGETTFLRLDLQGGEEALFVDDDARARADVAVDAERLYWVRDLGDEDSDIVSRPRDGTGEERTTKALPHTGRFDLDGDCIYFMVLADYDAGKPGAIYRVGLPD